MARIDIVVPCVDRKHGVTDGPALSDVCDYDLDHQLAAWEDELRAAGPLLLARERYKGEAWVESLRLETDAAEAGFSPVLWVTSAGYGLIAADDPIARYDATFSPPSDDDAGLDPAGRRSNVRRRQWWKALARSRSLATGRPRRLAEIPTVNDGAPVVVVASAAYAAALGQDLYELLSHQQAMLVCAGRNLDGTTDDPAFDSRLAGGLGKGTRLSLNQRAAGLVIHRLARGGGREEIAASLRESTARFDSVRLPDREPTTDAEVRRFITQQLRRDPTATKSPLLRLYRDQGNQCEQKRFGELYRQIKSEPQEGTLV